MKNRILNILRHFGLAIVLSAAALAVSNPDISWYPLQMTVSPTQGLVRRHPLAWRKVEVVNEETAVLAGPGATLKEFLLQDELADQNPFSTLSSMDPLEDIYRAGVERFERQTLRSSMYRDESGYDLVHYNINLKDGRRAQILAYVERPIEPEGEPAVRVEVPVVMVVLNSGDESAYSAFRDGVLIESSTILSAQAEALLADHLKQGIPIFAVSR